MAIVSYKEEDRQVARDWFGIVAGGTQCRSVSDAIHFF